MISEEHKVMLKLKYGDYFEETYKGFFNNRYTELMYYANDIKYNGLVLNDDIHICWMMVRNSSLIVDIVGDHQNLYEGFNDNDIQIQFKSVDNLNKFLHEFDILNESVFDKVFSNGGVFLGGDQYRRILKPQRKLP